MVFSFMSFHVLSLGAGLVLYREVARTPKHLLVFNRAAVWLPPSVGRLHGIYKLFWRRGPTAHLAVPLAALRVENKRSRSWGRAKQKRQLTMVTFRPLQRCCVRRRPWQRARRWVQGPQIN